MSILVMGSDNDPQIQAVLDTLKQKNRDHSYLDYTQDVSNISYQFNYSTGYLKNITAIYWRPPVHQSQPNEKYTLKDICQQQEAWNTIFPLDSVRNAHCINPMLNNLQMENKIVQLDLAVKCQLQIPKTLISCKTEEIKAFADTVGPCIEKNLGYNWNEDGTPAKTRMFTANNLHVNQLAPCIYQQFIKRKSEIRLYVIGELTLPVAINIHQDLAHIPDWRVGVKGYQYRGISDKTLNKIMNYHKKAGLIYAAYDLIIDQNGLEFFIECNPCGYWNFLPEDMSHSITNAIVEQLTINQEVSA